jgi:AcrR family transcriptional regulator
MPRHIFDRPQIIAAARRILDADGLGALTIRALAADLGTGPASVYRHVSNRQELLQLVADDLAQELPMPDMSLEPRNRLIAGWSELYDFFGARPWLVELLAAGEVVSDHASPLAAAQLATLEELDIGREEAGRVYQSLNALLIGVLCSSHPYAHGVRSHGESMDRRELFVWAVERFL